MAARGAGMVPPLPAKIDKQLRSQVVAGNANVLIPKLS